MDAFERYAKWCEVKMEDEDLAAELAAIKDDKDEIYERFYTDLVFGTGGLRGVLGAGNNRMNLYTVRRATQGICSWLKSSGKECSAAVSYDSRNKSDAFARATAEVFAANGIKVYIYNALAPTPLLSWAVRYYGCDTGVMITASHNPAEYNGYKAYDNNGCQITDKAAAEILECVDATDLFDGVLTCDFDKALADGRIEYVSEKAIADYYAAILACRCDTEVLKDSDLKVTYTALNGTGNLFVRHILKEIGAAEPVLVKEQMEPDGNFPTCSYPNPEIKAAIELGIKAMLDSKSDILIATDPDADRLGVTVRRGDEVVLLTGNEVGVLLADYIASARKAKGTMPEKPVMVKSIVSTTLAQEVAESYGVEMKNVLTGFKYIGDQIAVLEKNKEQDRFIFGFEESCGYLPSTYIREKDGVSAAMLVVEMAAAYKKQGKTLADAIEDIYKKFGYYYNYVTSTTFPGSQGMKQMADMMDKLFAAPPESFDEYKVSSYCDYRAGVAHKNGKSEPTGLPSSPVLSLDIEGAGTVIIRPSGTEPKLKVYYMVKGESREAAVALQAELEKKVRAYLGI